MIVTWIKNDGTCVDIKVKSIVDIVDKAKKLGFIPTGNWGYDSEREAYSLPGENGIIMVSAPLL